MGYTVLQNFSQDEKILKHRFRHLILLDTQDACCHFCTKKKQFYTKDDMQQLCDRCSVQCNQTASSFRIDGRNVFCNDAAYNAQRCLYEFKTWSTVVIGKQTDDTDGHTVAIIVSMVGTKHVVYYDCLDDGTRKRVYKAYKIEHKTIFNLDQNQVYFINRPNMDKSKEFSHFKTNDHGRFPIWYKRTAHEFLYQYAGIRIQTILYNYVVAYIFEEYHISLPCFWAVQHGLNSDLMRYLSVDEAFYMMKFPVFMKQLYDYLNPRGLCVVPNMITAIYWLSNADRPLRKILTCRDEHEYHQLQVAYLQSHFDDYAAQINEVHSPFWFLYAWQLSHVGIRTISYMDKLDKAYIQQFDLDENKNDQFNFWLNYCLSPRFHNKDKFLRRMVKRWGEYEFVQMILTSDAQYDYSHCTYMLFCINDWLKHDVLTDEICYSQGLDGISDEIKNRIN